VSTSLSTRVWSVLLAILSFEISLSWAANATPDAHQQAAIAARDAAMRAMVRGPASVTLRDQGFLKLPEHFGFVPQKEAAAVMQAMGNHSGDDFIGLIVPLRENAGESGGDWFVTLRYDAAGYIKDDDARHWDADGLLKTLKEGTEAGNADREREGIPPIMVTRWVEVPAYDAASHRLVWSAEVRLKNGSDPDPGVNYNTYVLGREGYISLDLVTAVSGVEHDKPVARQLLAAIEFKDGKRYGDFNSSTDKVAAYGLAALIAGVAAKKLGLLALIAAGAVKFWKLIAVAVAMFGATISRWFKARAGSKGPAA
jgi:uncharacterized membrane-anchored protein